MSGCPNQSHLKKYRERPGPPYPANEPGCRGSIKKGNDGVMYVSERASNGVYRWAKKVRRSASPAPRSPRSKSPPVVKNRPSPRRSPVKKTVKKTAKKTTSKRVAPPPSRAWRRLNTTAASAVGRRRVNLQLRSGEGAGPMHVYDVTLPYEDLYLNHDKYAWGSSQRGPRLLPPRGSTGSPPHQPDLMNPLRL